MKGILFAYSLFFGIYLTASFSQTKPPTPWPTHFHAFVWHPMPKDSFIAWTQRDTGWLDVQVDWKGHAVQIDTIALSYDSTGFWPQEGEDSERVFLKSLPNGHHTGRVYIDHRTGFCTPYSMLMFDGRYAGRTIALRPVDGGEGIMKSGSVGSSPQVIHREVAPRAGEPWPTAFRAYGQHYTVKDSSTKRGIRAVNDTINWFILFDYERKQIAVNKNLNEEITTYMFDSIVTEAFLGDSERVFMAGRTIRHGHPYWPFRIYLDRRVGWKGEYKATWVVDSDNTQYDLKPYSTEPVDSATNRRLNEKYRHKMQRKTL